MNEEAGQALELRTPVGSNIRYQGGQIEREVGGVLRDFQMTAIRKTIEPVMIEYGPGMFPQRLVIRTGEGEAPTVKSALKPLWMSLSPGHPLRMTHLDDAMTSLYDRDSRTVELRTFGASTIRILQHLSRQTLGLVGTGFILAIPVTWISIRYWLTDFAYAAPPDPLAYLASGGAVCLVILATFAAGIAPVLRSDPAPILRAGE